MCYSPITIKTPEGYKQVPCGHCLECLNKYQKEWSNRMYEELKSHNGKAVFFTLTYDDKSVPKNYLYFYNEKEYEIFRSPSQYSYDNTKSRVKGEKLKVRQDPDEELKSLGIDYQVIDFNVKRPQHMNFISHIHKIYSDYLNSFCDDSALDAVQDCPYDFDVDFTNPEDLFKEVMYDDNYEKVEPIKVSDNFRERPVMMFNSVRKKDVQDWLKRGRKTLSFSYFITSEYGPRTLRPHYHGILFGVTAQESWSMMLDWQKRYGSRISWTDLDLGKGDGSYCAKYCSKGFYEHPLCAKNFFYPNVKRDNEGNVVRPFTEYHSKHYERCIDLFGIDEPLVDPTFHLVSKGFGAGWIENNEDRLLEDFKDIDFINTVDEVPTLVVVRNTNQDKSLKEMSLEEIFEAPLDFSFQEKIYTRNSGSKDYAECIDRLFRNFKYKRVYKGQVCEYGVPRYYREKIFNPGLKVAFSNYVSQVNVELYRQKLAELQSQFPSWSDAQMVSYIEAQERKDIVDRMSNMKKRMEKQYNKSTI